MEIYEGSGEPEIESEETKVFLMLMSRLSKLNRSRYESQAKELLSQGRLTLPIGNIVLKYIVKDGWSGYKVSEDSGLHYSNFLSMMPLPWRRSAKIEKLIEQFAHSEARQTTKI